jgi:hypothetical protein
VTDSDAVRARRYRAHRQGDHHLCRHDLKVPVARPEAPPEGESAAVGADLDPAAELRALAGRLAAVYEADPGRTDIARELRMTLLALDGLPEPHQPDIIDELNARWATPVKFGD